MRRSLLILTALSAPLIAESAPAQRPASDVAELSGLIERAVRHHGLDPSRLDAAASRARLADATPSLALKASWGDEDDLRSVTRFDDRVPEPISYTYARDDGFELRAEAQWDPGAFIFSDQETQILRERRLQSARREALILTVVEVWTQLALARLEREALSERGDRPGQIKAQVQVAALTAQLSALTGGEVAR